MRSQIRCAVYTRKSTSEGLDREFNSLDAQREAGQAFIASQVREGWVCLPSRYDDGGYSGATIDRPALQRLMADIGAGKIDCVVTYKVDRLSRSLLDFAKLMETFDKHQVSFVSVTQQFNTAQSMGRLVLNVLLSFAQFERELISERTRDKMAATRRKGKWSGGRPLLGYDLDPLRRRLVINLQEAARVQEIFTLFLKKQALWPVVAELHRRGWKHKRWTTRAGIERGGEPFTTVSIQRLLTNPCYLGQVSYHGELYAGEHPAIVDTELWRQAQSLLQRRTRSNGASPGTPSVALLQGLLHCGECGAAMTPTHTSRRGKRYRYYACRHTWKHRSGKSNTIAASQIERLVWDRLGIHKAGGDTDNGGTHRPSEPATRVGLLVERVDFHPVQRQVTIALKNDGRSAVAVRVNEEPYP